MKSAGVPPYYAGVEQVKPERSSPPRQPKTGDRFAVSAYLPPESHRKLILAAMKDGRSKSSAIVQAIEEWANRVLGVTK